MGSIPAWGTVGSWGQVLPRPLVLRWAISRAFLCGVCMFSPCYKGFPPPRTPTEKTCRRTDHSPDQDGHDHLTWSPGAINTAHCSWQPWRKDSPGWDKCRGYISLRPPCVFQCVVCAIKNLTKV